MNRFNNCKDCIYYSKRGHTENGEFIQMKKGGILSGWCQYNPPTQIENNYNCWPIVTENESCGHFEEEKVDKCYYKCTDT